MNPKWKVVDDYRKTLCDLYDEDRDMKHLMMLDSIDHIMERPESYENILNFAEKRGIKRVVDIGCAYAFQSSIFEETDVSYMGVDEGVNGRFWNDEKFSFIKTHYPSPLPLVEGDLAISVLCLGWNVYLYEGEKTFNEQFEALSADFKHALLYIPTERLESIGRYFVKTEKVAEGLYYFSN